MYRPAVRLPLLVLLILLGFTLRINCLDCESLWLDEVDSVFWATIPPQEMLLDTINHAHTPAFYLLLNASIRLTGLSEFSVRFLSVWSGLFIIPLGYWCARKLWREPRAAFFTAFLFAISPAHINYSQETRMYALLPLLYLMMLGLVLQPGTLKTRRDWLLLTALEVIALYLHLFSVLMLLVINLLLLWQVARERDRALFRPWLISQGAAVLLFLPWLLILWRYGSAPPGNIAGTAGTPPAGLADYMGLLWYFLHSGIVTELPALRTMVTVLALFVVVVLPFLIYLDTRPRALAAQFAALFIPLLLAYAAWRLNPLTHPRYLIFLLAPLILLLARVLALLAAGVSTVWLTGAGLTLLIAVNGVALAHRSEESFDMRTLANDIAQRASTGDVVLMMPYDKSFWYYDPDPATVLNWPLLNGDQDGRATQLGRLLTGYNNAFLVQYDELYSHDPHGQLPFLLELNGELQERFSVDRMSVHTYSLHEEWQLPHFDDQHTECGPLALVGFFHEETGHPAQASVAALKWELQQELAQDIIVSVHLWDSDHDQRLAAFDTLLLDEQQAPTSVWTVGQQAVSYHILPVPLGTPPLSYSLTVQLVEEDGTIIGCSDHPQGLELAQLQVQPSPDQSRDAYGSWADTEWQEPLTTAVAPGLTLEGFAIRPAALSPAQSTFVTLRWRAEGNAPEALAPILTFQQDGELLSSSEGTLFERYPVTGWQEGELLIETRELPTPATLEPFELVLSLPDQTLPIASLALSLDALRWELPSEATPACARLGDVAELVGYQWQPPRRDEQTGHLTLYWRGQPGATSAPSYVVFAHILDEDGQVLTQHDGIPAGEQRPTNSWLPGEVIADERTFDFSQVAPDQGQIAVGMYDLDTGERVPAFDCADQPLPANAIAIGTLGDGRRIESRPDP